MKIAVLHPSYAGANSPFEAVDSEYDPSQFLPEVEFTNFYLTKNDFLAQLLKISQDGFDAVVNLCDGAADEDRPGREVVETLERLRIAFTGANSNFYEPTRAEMKSAAGSVGVLFPLCVMVECLGDVGDALRQLRFPMIVKHSNSYGSIGLTRDSRVTDADSLRREVQRMLADFGGALVEEFIDGREFTALVSEPRDGDVQAWVHPPLECRFPAGETFNHFDLKWYVTDCVQSDSVEDDLLASRLCEASASIFQALSGSGYARCDFRMNAAGELFFLEINPNCGIFSPRDIEEYADKILQIRSTGQREFLQHLLFCAQRRQKRATNE